MTTFDLTPLLRSTIGFDRMTELLEAGFTNSNGSGYPPYNIIKEDEDNYRITMAVAGFSEDDIDITAQDNFLIVQGKIAETENEEETIYLHRGIAGRAFERRFQLDNHIRVTGASIEHGLLHISMLREVPEQMKPRKIEILSADKLIDQKKSDVA